MKKNKTLSLILVSAISYALSGCDFVFPWNKPTDSASETPSDSASEIETQTVTHSETPTATQTETPTSTQTETPTSTQTVSESESESVAPVIEVNMNFKFPKLNNLGATVEQMSALPAYTPTTFSTSTYSKTLDRQLADGANVYKCNFTVSGRNVTAYVVEVDLKKVTIAAGSYNNSHEANFANLSVPVNQASAWERDNEGRKVLAIVNADFFGSTCVNAFVKDGVILKDAHINDPNDLPVSSPMLFGVSSAGARIGAMTTTGNRNTDYTTALSYGSMVEFYNGDGSFATSLNGGYTDTSVTAKSTYTVCTKLGNYRFLKGYVYKFKIIENENNILHGCIVEKTKLTAGKSMTVKDDGYGYISVGDYVTTELEPGYYFASASYVTSPKGGIWDHYDTIIGARHSLIEDGLLPETLYRENSNGTSYYCPRTAVGIKPDGTVCVVSIEDLHYGGKASSCTGATAVQLADFMRYYGCYDACNFDGGGSSQLCVKNTAASAFTVLVRSSDTGSATPSSTRKVLNTLMVVTK